MIEYFKGHYIILVCFLRCSSISLINSSGVSLLSYKDNTTDLNSSKVNSKLNLKTVEVSNYVINIKINKYNNCGMA